MKASVKSAFLMFVLCLSSNGFFAQGLTVSEDMITDYTYVTSNKDELIRKYLWDKSHFESTHKPPTKVSEVLSGGQCKFGVIETKNMKVLYDTQGKTYYTDLKSHYRSRFYKISLGELQWLPT